MRIPADFPLPGTTRVLQATSDGSSRTYHVDWVAWQVARWYDGDAEQASYFFRGSTSGPGPWTFLFRKPTDPPCRGIVTIANAPGGPTTLLDVSLSTQADAFPLTEATLPPPLPCNGVYGELGDFPYYPGSLNVGVAADGTGAVWHTYAAPPAAASFYANGASQVEYKLRLDGRTQTSWSFTWWRQSDSSCWGTLVVSIDPAGSGTLVEFHISRERGSQPPIVSPMPS